MNPFKMTGSLRPSKSMFDLSYEVKGSCDIGWLFPTFVKMMSPGDVFKLGAEMVMRMNPMINPIMHQVDIVEHTFFIPLRLLDEDWEDKFTGGQDGESPAIGEENFPIWSGNKLRCVTSNSLPGTPNRTFYGLYSLWDYLGLGAVEMPDTAVNGPISIPVTDYLLRAYNKVFNDYYRDQNREPEIPYPYDRNAVIEADQSDTNRPYSDMHYFGEDANQNPILSSPGMVIYQTEKNLFWGSWEKDRFTVSLPWQQRGPSPAIGLLGEAQITWDNLLNPPYGTQNVFASIGVTGATTPGMSTFDFAPAAPSPNIVVPSLIDGSIKSWLKNNIYVDLANATAGDINDIRQAFQLQKFLERNARIGARYFEQLAGRFGVFNLDIRLDRPEYISGSRTPLLISEVLNTNAIGESSGSNMDKQQLGSFGGHGLVADKRYIGKYRAPEHGIIMTLCCVKPKPTYDQGIDKEFTFTDRLDFIHPEFVNLSEVAVNIDEIFAMSDQKKQNMINAGAELDIGYIGKYDEYRISQNKLCGLMRTDSFRSWHLGRSFSDTMGNHTDGSPYEFLPQMTSQFIRINPYKQKRIFAVTGEHGLLYTKANIVHALRTLPIIAEPGLIDHH